MSDTSETRTDKGSRSCFAGDICTVGYVQSVLRPLIKQVKWKWAIGVHLLSLSSFKKWNDPREFPITGNLGSTQRGVDNERDRQSTAAKIKSHAKYAASSSTCVVKSS